MDFQTNSFFEQVLFESFGKNTALYSFQMIAGGCIHNAVKLETVKGVFFLKYNPEAHADMFEVEAKGLKLLANTNIIKIPEIISFQKSYLLLNFVESMPEAPNYWENLGFKLAELHQNTHPYFGLDHNNYIGSLRQNNENINNGVEFLIEKRFRVQASLAMYHQLIDKNFYKKFEIFYQKLPNLIPEEKPALLHGDLWSGNIMTDENGQPVLLDPAIYYGFREMELAFTQLFGGFDNKFYTTYQESFPLEPDFDARIEIYNLYPLLVHLNLFGTSYLTAVQRIIEKYV